MKLTSRILTPLVFTAILAASALTNNVARAQDAAVAKSNPALQTPEGKAAYQLLKESAAAYKRLNSYSSHIAAKSETQVQLQGQIKWQRPQRLLAEGSMGQEEFRTFFSGDQHINVLTSPYSTRYTKGQVDEKHSIGTSLTDFSRLGLTLAYYMESGDPLKSMLPIITALRIRPVTADDAIGVDLPLDALQVVQVDLPVRRVGSRVPAIMTYVLGKTDKLLRRATFSCKVGARHFWQNEIYNSVQVNPKLPAHIFTFKPTATAQRVDVLHPPADERLKIGAKPFALKALDLQGQPMSFDDYKGKVVLLDFWATWCGPCIREMPNVMAAYDKYHAQGFDVIGVSLDEDKAAVTKFVADNKMPWRQVFDGKGWGSAVSKQFGVYSIPFTLLIGRDGKIAAMNLRGDALEKAVATALSK